MKSTTLPSPLPCKLPAALLLAAALLPYSAPVACSMFDRMDHHSQMPAEAGIMSVQAPDAASMCCSLTGCNVASVGPLVFSTGELRELPVVAVNASLFFHRPLSAIPPSLPPPP